LGVELSELFVAEAIEVVLPVTEEVDRVLAALDGRAHVVDRLCGPSLRDASLESDISVENHGIALYDFNLFIALLAQLTLLAKLHEEGPVEDLVRRSLFRQLILVSAHVVLDNQHIALTASASAVVG